MTMNQPTRIVKMDLQVGTHDLGPHWMAFEPRLGLAVFHQTEEGAVQRLSEAVDFTFDSISGGTTEGQGVLQQYLDNHGVEYNVVESQTGRSIMFSKEPNLEFAYAG